MGIDAFVHSLQKVRIYDRYRVGLTIVNVDS